MFLMIVCTDQNKHQIRIGCLVRHKPFVKFLLDVFLSIFLMSNLIQSNQSNELQVCILLQFRNSRGNNVQSTQFETYELDFELVLRSNFYVYQVDLILCVVYYVYPAVSCKAYSVENSIIGPKYNGISSLMDRPVRTSKILTKMNLIYSARGLKLPHSRQIGVKCTLKDGSFFLDFPQNILKSF